jgi:dihydroorotate dehydrogenase electron transfer subunit
VKSTLFYGARRAQELFYLDFFRRLGVELVLTTEDGSVGERGRVVTPLERRLASQAGAAPVMVYACGPEGMLAAAATTAARFDRPCQVSVERIMGCGLGGCYSCVMRCGTETAVSTTSARASPGRCCRGIRSYGVSYAYSPQRDTMDTRGIKGS